MTPTLVLASQSPRRQELVSLLGLPWRVQASGVSEEVDGNPDPAHLVRLLSRRKAEFVAALPSTQLLDQPLVIAADTVVVCDGVLLGKPASAEEATITLRQLRGRDHLVHTGLCVLEPGGEAVLDVHTAVVTMRSYSDDEIRAYIATGDPLDKAGSYGIQHATFRPVERLEGCFLAVMGLSLCQLVGALGRYDTAVDLGAAQLAALHEGYECPIMPLAL